MVLRHDPLAHPELLIRRVYAYAAYRLGDGPDAEDVTSSVFERALRYQSSFDPRKGEPIAWLLGIARRSVDELGAKRTPLASDPPDEAAPGNVEEETVERLRLAAALADLEERDRELIALRYGADLTAREIGALLGVQTNAIEVALHRARGRLREALTADEPELPWNAGERRAFGRP